MLSLKLSHLFFVVDSKKLADKLRVDRNNLNQLVPKLENLGTHKVYVLN